VAPEKALLHCLNEKFNKSGCLKCNGPSDFKEDCSKKPNDPFGGAILQNRLNETYY
jgi:hypothetical protein